MFLTNYEKQLTKLKSLKDNSDITREYVANQFYGMVRKDYLSKNSEMKAYKAATLPIIKAMNILTKDLHFENKLSLDERKEINRKVYEDVEKRFQSYENKLAAHIAVNGVTTDDELSYKELKDLVINELKTKNSYNVIAKKRDISNQKNYKVAIKKIKQTVVEDNTNKSSENKQPKYKVTVKRKNSQKDRKSKKLYTEQAIYQQEVGPIEGEFVDVEQNNSMNNNTFRDDNQLIRDNIHFNDTIIDSDDNTIQDGTIIDDSFKDDNGNLDSTVKDVTTDSTGAVNGDAALPDPNGSEQTMNGNQSNNEVVADQIIEDMANSQASSSDSIKVFYKK